MKKEKIISYPFMWVEKRTKSKKPVRNDDGILRYKDFLQYLVRVMPQDHPSFDFVLNLASFATSGNLSSKQAEKVDDMIMYCEKEGII